MKWIVEFYEELNSSCPIEAFLNKLSMEERAKVFQVIQLLEEHGPTLSFPFSSQIEGKLRELRTQYGKSRFRILYYADLNRAFVLLHGIKKQTQKLNEEDKRIALNRIAIDTERKKKKGGKS